MRSCAWIKAIAWYPGPRRGPAAIRTAPVMKSNLKRVPNVLQAYPRTGYFTEDVLRACYGGTKHKTERRRGKDQGAQRGSTGATARKTIATLHRVSGLRDRESQSSDRCGRRIRSPFGIKLVLQFCNNNGRDSVANYICQCSSHRQKIIDGKHERKPFKRKNS